MLQPSSRAVEAVDRQRKIAGESIVYIGQELFFRATGNEKLVRDAVVVVLHETEQNWRLDTEINPENPSPEGFPEGLRELLVSKLMEEEEDELDFSAIHEGVDLYDLENLRNMPAEALVFLVCSAHEISVEELLKSFTKSGKISPNSSGETKQQSQQERWVTTSLTAVGTLSANSLAYVITQRRKK